MEYYFYILVVVALFLKLGLYFCWYHMRRRAALAREVHIVMPDGTTRRAVVAGPRRTRRSRREDRQILTHSDALQHGDNQGFEERPAYPHVMTGNAPVGSYPEPPPYAGIIGSGSSGEWKLPKYEELPPPYTNASPTETGCSASQVPPVPQSTQQAAASISTVSSPQPTTSQPPPPAEYSVQVAATGTATSQQLPNAQEQPQPASADNSGVGSSSPDSNGASESS